MNQAAALTIVILTEDSGKDGRATVEALARRMLGLVGLRDCAALVEALELTRS